jgi:hypothetical protein
LLHRLSTAALLAALLAAPTAADVLTGTVVDGAGQPIVQCDIDIEDQVTGNELSLSGDFTDASGVFSIVVPPGFYRVSFNPPAPPASTAFPDDVKDVVVAGVKSMGVVQLASGVGLYGTVVTSGGLPIAGINIDIENATTGEELDLAHDVTSASGQFAVPSITGPVRLQLKATGIFPTLASKELELTITGDTILGNIPLSPGFIAFGVVRTPSGQAVPGADIDARDVATGAKVYTPGDNTDFAGQFTVTVPAGTYDFEACPKFADLLAPGQATGVLVTSTTNVGQITVLPGAILSGTVTDAQGTPFADADIDLDHPVTGVSVPICGDNTDAVGAYAVVVPKGTWTVVFEPTGFDVPYGADVHASLSIQGNTVLHGVIRHGNGGDRRCGADALARRGYAASRELGLRLRARRRAPGCAGDSRDLDRLHRPAAVRRDGSDRHLQRLDVHDDRRR